jgi:hypothetical protein
MGIHKLTYPRLGNGTLENFLALHGHRRLAHSRFLAFGKALVGLSLLGGLRLFVRFSICVYILQRVICLSGESGRLVGLELTIVFDLVWFGLRRVKLFRYCRERVGVDCNVVV